MHPTTEEHLAAVRRLLDDVARDPGVGETSRAALEEASRRLRRVERSSAARLPFLVRDNRACLELLAGLTDLAPDVAAAIPAIDAGAEHHEPDAHRLNKELRGLLTRAVHQVPADEAGDAWRVRLALHLRQRIGSDPAINRPAADREAS